MGEYEWVWKDHNVLEFDDGDNTTLEIHKEPLNGSLKKGEFYGMWIISLKKKRKEKSTSEIAYFVPLLSDSRLSSVPYLHSLNMLSGSCHRELTLRIPHRVVLMKKKEEMWSM